MRTPKYHDYRVVKIALFIILVILGLFIYIKCIRTPLEHTAGENAWTVVEEATCTKDGLRCKICTECGEKFDHEVIPATGHTEGSWVVDKNATCTEDGTKHLACKNCNVSLDVASIPATGHSTGDWIVDKQPTCTEEGSKYLSCEDCDAKLDTDTVEKLGHSYGPEHDIQITVDSTHTKPGTYTATVTCTRCRDEQNIEVVDGVEPKGHSYSWELEYDGENGKFVMTGTCTCDEEGNVVILDAEDGLTVTLDKTVPSCCRKLYVGTVIYQGVEYTSTVELEPDPHSIIRIEAYDPSTGEMITIYKPISDFAHYDENYGTYYYYDTEGIIFLNHEGNEWDENGFALGVYECVLCEDKLCSECDGKYWYIVRIYSPEHDTRLAESEN